MWVRPGDIKGWIGDHAFVFGMCQQGYKVLTRKEAIDRYDKEFLNEQSWVHFSAKDQ